MISSFRAAGSLVPRFRTPFPAGSEPIHGGERRGRHGVCTAASWGDRPAAARSPAGSPAGTREAPPAPRDPTARSRAAAPPPAPVSRLRLREVLSRLSLARQDVSEASGLVNRVVSQLIRAIRSKEGSFGSIERLGAGSYYERVKLPLDPFQQFHMLLTLRIPELDTILQIFEPNEFDIMLVMPVARLQLEECDDTGAFYYLTFKRNPKEKYLLKFLDEDGKLSAFKMLQALRDIIKQEVKNIKRNTWRLSFSHIEKAMMNNHGSSKTCCESDGPKCCRKGCLKLLKYLLERLKMKYPKELEKFFSYHVKTAFFHACVMWPNDTDWHSEDLDHCFQKYLGYFLDCLQKSKLPHFFIPQYNLLSPEDKASSNFLSRQINYQLNNGFPIFQEMC
ncbi:cyclic GMP-AMP synthase isoform X3 [Cuculus canorus]|uniref:cyclic GMP-AMP synthase isoform X3 n=1 Tax=Cuculus canorus TaxID=55661 RepID=UPI0023AB0BAA|nr:cyclic GMP-AMP synthase isoform X3 [Cuculus canorus]